MRYKNFSRIIIIIALISASFMVFFSFYIVHNHQLQMAEVVKSAYELKNKQLEYSLPLRVIENVSSVYNRDHEISDTMTDAYHRNQLEAEIISDEINQLIHQINTFVTDSPLNNINSYKHTLHIISDSMTKLTSLNQQVQDYLQLDLTSKNEIQVLSIIEEDMNTSIKLTQKTLNGIEDRAIRDTYFLNAFVIMLLILLLFALVLLNFRFQYFHKKFIVKSYKMVDMNQYDFKELETVKPLFFEEKAIYNQIQSDFEEHEITETIKNIVRESYDMDKVMRKLFVFVQEHMDVQRIGIAFIDHESGKIITEGAYSNTNNHIIDVGYTVNIQDTSLKELLYNHDCLINNDLDDYLTQHPQSKHVKNILLENIHSNMVFPLISNNQTFALMFFSSTSKNHFTEYHLRMGKRILYEISEIVKRSYLIAIVFKSYLSSMAELVDNRDNETGNHLSRMTKYSEAIAIGLKEANLPGYEVDSDFIIEIKNNALSHDIGKVAIADHILKKSGKLTEEEFDIMKTHVNIGVELIRKIRKPLQSFDSSYFKYAEDIISGHHEKWDGSGYPNGLKEEEIPLAGRIVAVADVFDALTSKRVYKNALNFDASVQIILDGKGRHFDPILVDVFVNNIEMIKAIYDHSL